MIARPGGEQDVPLGTVAQPVLRALQPLRPRVQLDVLRPPTFDNLQRTLNARRGYYQLVHFDGHGVFVPGPANQFGTRAERGHLAFEKLDGSADVVNSQDLGQALATCRVPLFVLNACQSAEEGQDDPFASVAAQLVATGASGVVAMSYSVYVSTAVRFMERFYQSLVDHASLAQAVAAGRQRVFAEPEHDSLIGPLTLRDWLVPTLYQQEYGLVPVPPGATEAVAAEATAAEAVRQQAEATCPAGKFGFVGRDYDLLRIERALRDNQRPWVLLTGVGGTGKTELARGFARWYAETGGCPGGVFATSFKEKADFGQVIGSLLGYASDLSALPPEQQRQILVNHLRANRCLLIWDNFESVAGYPDGNDPLATLEQQTELAGFLQALRGGQSQVLITTRKPAEPWLGLAYRPLEIGGLRFDDAMMLATTILSTIDRRPADFKDDPAYARLVSLLAGHPRSMEIVLPRLRFANPTEVIDTLQHRVDDLGESLADASLAYAFAGLSQNARRHLPFLGLFASRIFVDTLCSFVSAGNEQQEVYRQIRGEALDETGWRAILDEASRAGLLGMGESGLYELPPTLPSFLRQQLGQEGARRLDQEFASFYASLANAFFDRLRNADRFAVALTGLEEANLLRALRLAELGEEWEQSQTIAQTIGEYYAQLGRRPEWQALRDRLLSRLGLEQPANTTVARMSLWMYLLGNQAIQAIQSHQLALAEATYLRILEFLTADTERAIGPMTAVVYHQLGRVAEERQQFDQAEQWYRRALEIYERLGLERNAASDYHQLGMVAQDRQQFDQAEQWYRRALGIEERLGHPPLLVNTLAQVGVLERRRGRPVEAIPWYGRALAIAAEYQMRVGGQILAHLSAILDALGEDAFVAVWRQAFGGQEPPLEAIRAAGARPGQA